MLLFHGTSADDAKLASILRDGLRAGPKAWAGHLVPGEDAFVFLCTSPVGSKGGDPIDMARGWPYRSRRSPEHARTTGYLIVVELPEPSPVPILGAARNVDVEVYWRVRAFATLVGGGAAIHDGARYLWSDVTAFAALRRVFTIAGAQRTSVAALLRSRTLHMTPGLVDGEVRPPELAAFGRAYTRAATAREKATLARAAGVNVPPEFTRDPHWGWCFDCFTAQLYAFGYTFAGLPPIDGGDFVIQAQAAATCSTPPPWAPSWRRCAAGSTATRRARSIAPSRPNPPSWRSRAALEGNLWSRIHALRRAHQGAPVVM